LQLCDKDLSKKKTENILISDLLIDQDLQNIKFDTRKVKVELETEMNIECGLCDFTEHELIMCLDLKKLNVCLKNKQSTTESSYFDKGNYLFVIFLDYMNSMYSFKKRTSQNERDSYALGEDHDINTLSSGIPGFMGDGYIEMAWSPHLRGVDFNRIMAQIGDCCDKKE